MSKLYIIVLFSFGVLVMVTQGCKMEDWIKIKTPAGMTGLPAKVTITEGKQILDKKILEIKQLDAAIKEGQIFSDALSGFLMQYGDNVFAGAGVAGTMGFGLLGLFVGKRKTQKEKERSYRKGGEDKFKTLMAIKNESI